MLTDEQRKARLKESQHRYNISAKGKAKVRRYQHTEKGIKAMRRAQMRHWAKKLQELDSQPV